MTIERIWRALESEAAAGGRGAWISRFALPDAGNTLLVAIDTSSMSRALLLPLSTGVMPARRLWPQCRGLKLFGIDIDGVSHIGVCLVDGAYSDVFSALAEDIAPRVAAAADESGAACLLLDRLRQWQKFLTARADPLSVSRQRGLFGELYVLRHILAPAIGWTSALAGWRASFAAHQDFQLAQGSIEVKTTTAKQPQDVRITSERQLDGTGTRALFLLVAVVDERDVEAERNTEGETLPESIAAIRERLGPSVALRDAFDDRLLGAGYLDGDAPQLETRRYTPRSQHCFRVGPGFPRIIETDLPIGTGDISYALSLAACAPFAVSVELMTSQISGSPEDEQATPSEG